MAAVLIFITISVCSIQQIWYSHWGSDPRVFLHAASLLVKGQDIVSVPDRFGLYYVYPPLFAFLFIPLTFLPVEVVIPFWTLASVVLLGWSMAAFYSGMMGRPFFSIPQKTRWIVCFFTVLLTTRFTLYHLQAGQSDIFVLALVVLGLVFLSRNQEFRSGIAIGLSIVIKIVTIPFVFWFLARRRPQVIAALVLGCLIGIGLPALVVGVEKDLYYHRQWLKVVMANAPGTGNSSGVGNLSPRAQVDRFFLNVPAFEYKGRSYPLTIAELRPGFVRVIGYLLMLIIALAIIWYAVRFRNANPLVSQWGGFALVFSLIPSFSTWTEVHHLVFLIPAYMYVVHLWYSHLVTDRLFRALVLLSFVLTTLTTKAFCGVFLSRLLTALGFVSYGMLLLSAAIFRAASCLEKDAAGPGGEDISFSLSNERIHAFGSVTTES